MDTMWIMSSKQFVERANQNKTSNNAGKRSIWFNGKRTDKTTKAMIEQPYPKFDEYKETDFSIFRKITGLVLKPELDGKAPLKRHSVPTAK